MKEFNAKKIKKCHYVGQYGGFPVSITITRPDRQWHVQVTGPTNDLTEYLSGTYPNKGEAVTETYQKIHFINPESHENRPKRGRPRIDRRRPE